MQWIDSNEWTPRICELVSRMEEDRCTLRWRWPEGLQAVYIHRTSVDGPSDPLSSPEELKLYTRDEYKANVGYHDRLEGFGRIAYTVYATLMEDGEIKLIRQQDRQNVVEVAAGRAKIKYTLKQKSRLLQKLKRVQIVVTAEVPVPKEVLCYVKKQGSLPLNKEDGMLYHFVQPFEAGINVLPEIEIAKNDYIRLFFTDGPRYGQLYELVAE